MFQSLHAYVARGFSWSSLGALLTIAGAYRAYLGGLPENKLTEWVNRRNSQMDVIRTCGSPIFAILMVLEGSVITFGGVVQIANAVAAAPGLEGWWMTIRLLLGLVMICGSWVFIYWTNRPFGILDHWQMAYEARNFRSGNIDLVREYVGKTGFVLIAGGAIVQQFDIVIGGGPLSLSNLFK